MTHPLLELFRHINQQQTKYSEVMLGTITTTI